LAGSKQDSRAWIAGVVWCVAFHFVLGGLLFGAATSGKSSEASQAAQGESPRRRAAFGESALRDRRPLEGPYPRLRGFVESRVVRREILDVRGRRRQFDGNVHPYRFLELSRGRRTAERARKHDDRGIDFGPADEQILMAMLIPKLGMKKADKYHLPRLTKYEQPERMEDGINISRENLDAKELKRKAHKRKKAEYDRKRKKNPSLADLIDAPEDDDPRARASQLEEIVGVATGSVHGRGTEGTEGNAYLAKVQTAIQRSFNVPVFLSREDLAKLVVDIEVRQMDGRGRILAYKLRKQSSSGAFNSAALEAIRRFVPSEGGSKTLPAPDTEMLSHINKRGILVRLEGRKLR
jgi:hypothetical protein